MPTGELATGSRRTDTWLRKRRSRLRDLTDRSLPIAFRTEHPSSPLHEHPAMALEVLGPVALPVLIRFDIADDGSAPLLRLLEMRIDIVDVDQHAVDDVC